MTDRSALPPPPAVPVSPAPLGYETWAMSRRRSHTARWCGGDQLHRPLSWSEPVRPPGGGGAGSEGLGRSRGGFTSKAHLSADGRCRPLSLIVTPGQRAYCTQFTKVPATMRVPRRSTPRCRIQTRSPSSPPPKAAQRPTLNAHPRVPATPGYPAHHPEEGRQPGRPPAAALTIRLRTSSAGQALPSKGLRETLSISSILTSR